MRVGPTLDKIANDYGDDVAIVFRHRPLPMHRDAKTAALAMQAAHRQGKAWEMHDKMFTQPKNVGKDAVQKLAADLRLDVDKFKAAMDDPTLAKEVEADEKVADEVLARGTPTFFINGRRLVGAKPFGAFKTVIDEELVKANALIEKGTPIEQIYDQLAKNQKKN